MKAHTTPVSLEARREKRRKELPAAMSPEQLRKRAVTKMRHNLASLAEDKYEDAKRWLEMIEITDGPRAALDSYLKLLEFAVPKLTRAEVSVEDHTGKESMASMSIEDLQQIIRDGVAAEARTIEGLAYDATKNRDSEPG